MDDPIWSITREAYLTYRDVKRRLRQVIKDYNASYNRLERAFRKFIEAQAEAVYRIEDPLQKEKLMDAYSDLQKRKLEHKQCHESYSDLLKEFRDAEAHYCITVFRVLRDKYGMTLMDLGSIFGVWHSSIANWIELDDNASKLGELYDEEFGELSSLEDVDEDD